MSTSTTPRPPAGATRPAQSGASRAARSGVSSALPYLLAVLAAFLVAGIVVVALGYDPDFSAGFALPGLS